jgi:hypothetical protein
MLFINETLRGDGDDDIFGSLPYKLLNLEIKEGDSVKSLSDLVSNLLDQASEANDRENQLSTVLFALSKNIHTAVFRTSNAVEELAVLRRTLTPICSQIQFAELRHDILMEINAGLRSAVNSNLAPLVEAYVDWYHEIRTNQNCSEKTVNYVDWSVEYRTIHSMQCNYIDIARILTRYGARPGRYCCSTFVNQNVIESLSPEMYALYEESRWRTNA